MVAVYILLNEDETFHTIIVKKKYNDFTYIAFLGYSGGGEYDEFYAKTKYNDELGLSGFYSRSNGSGEWENKLLSLKFNDEKERFINESEELFDFMDKDDQKIQFELLNETIEKIDEISLSKKLVKLGRDEGKVLTSQWTKFAVTKWFNAEVNNRKINNLSTEDIETLTNALKIKLIEISKN